MAAPKRNPGTPFYSFKNDPNTGLYRKGGIGQRPGDFYVIGGDGFIPKIYQATDRHFPGSVSQFLPSWLELMWQ